MITITVVIVAIKLNGTLESDPIKSLITLISYQIKKRLSQWVHENVFSAKDLTLVIKIDKFCDFQII